MLIYWPLIFVKNILANVYIYNLIVCSMHAVSMPSRSAEPRGDDDDSLSAGAIAVIVLAVIDVLLLIVILVVLLIIICLWIRKKKRSSNYKIEGLWVQAYSIAT